MIRTLTFHPAPALKLISGLIVLALLSACGSAPVTPTQPPAPEDTPTPLPPTDTPVPTEPFRVIGYFTDAGIVEAVPFQYLTHINYAFIIPNDDGTLAPVMNSWKLKNLIATAHQRGVKVLPSIGGWGWDAQFEALSADPATRKVFIEQLVKLVNDYQFDGIDMDWEYPDPGQSAQNFALLIHELRVALPPGKLLTAAVAARGEGADGVLAETFADFDFINLMVYDGDHGAGHAPYQYAVDSLAYWSERGLPKEKMVLGVPFYAHPNWVSYRKLVDDNPANAQLDETEYLGTTMFYNGIPTIVAKTQLAMQQASGMMFWTIEMDTFDDTSLIKAIHETAYGK